MMDTKAEGLTSIASGNIENFSILGNEVSIEGKLVLRASSIHLWPIYARSEAQTQYLHMVPS